MLGAAGEPWGRVEGRVSGREAWGPLGGEEGGGCV